MRSWPLAHLARVEITPHAVEQYRRHWAPRLTIGAARFELEHAIIAHGTPTKERTPLGNEIWVAGEVRLVIKRDYNTRVPAIVTVLEPRQVDHSSDPPPEDADPDATRVMFERSLSSATLTVLTKLARVHIAQREYLAAKYREDEVRARLSLLPPPGPR